MASMDKDEQPQEDEQPQDDQQTQEDEQTEYAKQYSEPSFWAKVGRFFMAAGRELVEQVLILKYVAESPDTPRHVKALIYSCLGYFISPIDAIPDLTPVVGFADDLGAVIATIALLAVHITPEIKERARKKADEIFGVDREEDDDKN